VSASLSTAIRTGVAIIGAACERWARALRAIDGVSVEPITGDDGLIEALSREDIDAVAFAGASGDLVTAIKRALMANRHVFVAGTPAIATKQLLSLDALARRRSRVLMFDSGALGDERVDFVRRMVTGPQPLWRPRYVRSLRTGASDAQTLDEIAVGDISFALHLLGATPVRVSALAPRIDETDGAAGVALITLVFESGAIARFDVSLVEPQARHEVAIACDGRTVLLDAFDARAPLQIQAERASRQGGWAETVTEHPAAEPMERAAVVAEAFVTAVRARDVSASNTGALAVATSVWEAARESMAADGAMIEIGERAAERRPALKLIVGGGHIDDSYPAPELKIVSRKPASERREPPEPPEPLRSA
jgi:predicted dehydrogenase